MDLALEWVKKAVGLCASFDRTTKKELEAEFNKLEKEYRSFSDTAREKIRHILRSQFINEDLIYVFSFFVQYMDIDDFRNDVLDCLIRSNYDCYTNSMLEAQVIVKVPGFYEKKRQLHRRNVIQLRDVLGINYSYLNKEQRNNKRIVIITEQILNYKHAPTKAVLECAVAMKKMGYEVMVFVCPCDMVLGQEVWYEAVGFNCVTDLTNQQFRIEHNGEIIDAYQVNMNEEGLFHYKKMIELIYEFKPLFVYSMGMFNPIGDVVQSFITTVSRKYSLGLPVSEADIIVEIKGEAQCDDIKYIDSHQKVYEEKSGVAYFDISDNMVSRAELGLPEDKFLISIVGNRLDTEIDEVFIGVMEEISKRVDNVGFVIIGQVSTLKEQFEKSTIANKIFCLGYCEDVMSVYRTLDLYVNPRRTGGGYSSLMALIMQIPVVTLPDCDVAFNAGDDFVVDDYELMIEQVVKYYTDKEYYKNQKDKTKRFAEANSKERAEEALEKKLKALIKYVEENSYE